MLECILTFGLRELPQFSNSKRYFYQRKIEIMSTSLSSIRVPTANAQQVINKRYSLKNEKGQPTETWGDVTKRVVWAIAKAETDEAKRSEFNYYMMELIGDRVFLPNTPCLVNAGKPNGQLAACFVLPVDDSIKGIMKTATDAAIIHQTGGGTGFTFQHLRPANSTVNSSHGVASGPVSFMEIYDKVTDVVKQGGVRRGANMGIMSVTHPDILRFIHAKNDQHSLTNFNISVAVTDDFMDAVKNNKLYQTQFNGKPWKEGVYDPITNSYADNGRLYAPLVWRRIIESAHKYGEPGVVFIDTVNKENLLKSLGELESSNPCGEQFLHPYNSCNLGSIDVAKFYEPELEEGNPYTSFNWDKFSHAIKWSVRFLDNVIDVCHWPLSEIEDVVKRTRPVGLGIMGFADLCLKMKIKYGESESLGLLEQLLNFMRREAWKTSCGLGNEKGAFPEYWNNQDKYDAFLKSLNDTYMGVPRNYEVTTIAPTGTISLVAETSSGIEPNFAWTYTRTDTVGQRQYVHPLAAAEWDLVDNDPHTGIITSMKPLPEYFVTAHDLSAEQHVRVLAKAQEYIDNSVSKTCNGHADDTVESVKDLYELAYSLGVKACSYYRDGSRVNQVLTTQKCPECGQSIESTAKCDTCTSCGWSKCNI